MTNQQKVQVMLLIDSYGSWKAMAREALLEKNDSAEVYKETAQRKYDEIVEIIFNNA